GRIVRSSIAQFTVRGRRGANAGDACHGGCAARPAASPRPRRAPCRDSAAMPSMVSSYLMKIHEYQGKTILARHGVPVPRGEVAFNAAEAGEIARRLGGGVVVVKAQIHAGGRGKGGGVKLAKSPKEAETIAHDMIGMTLVTHQTGPDGRVVARVLVEEG